MYEWRRVQGEYKVNSLLFPVFMWRKVLSSWSKWSKRPVPPNVSPGCLKTSQPIEKPCENHNKSQSTLPSNITHDESGMLSFYFFCFRVFALVRFYWFLCVCIFRFNWRAYVYVLVVHLNSFLISRILVAILILIHFAGWNFLFLLFCLLFDSFAK